MLVVLLAANLVLLRLCFLLLRSVDKIRDELHELWEIRERAWKIERENLRVLLVEYGVKLKPNSWN